MPIDYKKNYVGWWRQFSEYIRFERAENRCECTGECGMVHVGRCIAKNGQFKLKGLNVYERIEGKFYNKEFWSKVTLTVAHLDFDGGVCQCKKLLGIKCAIPAHCKAMCNGCHLSCDRDSHNKKRAENIKTRKDSGRKLFDFIQ